MVLKKIKQKPVTVKKILLFSYSRIYIYIQKRIIQESVYEITFFFLRLNHFLWFIFFWYFVSSDHRNDTKMYLNIIYLFLVESSEFWKHTSKYFEHNKKNNILLEGTCRYVFMLNFKKSPSLTTFMGSLSH